MEHPGKPWEFPSLLHPLFSSNSLRPRPFQGTGHTASGRGPSHQFDVPDHRDTYGRAQGCIEGHQGGSVNRRCQPSFVGKFWHLRSPLPQGNRLLLDFSVRYWGLLGRVVLVLDGLRWVKKNLRTYYSIRPLPGDSAPLGARVAVSYSVLQYITRHDSKVGVMQCVAVCCSVCRSVLQCAAVCCSVLQCVAVCSSVFQCVTRHEFRLTHNLVDSGEIRNSVKLEEIRNLAHTATHCNTLQHTVTQSNTMQHKATHCIREVSPCRDWT